MPINPTLCCGKTRWLLGLTSNQPCFSFSESPWLQVIRVVYEGTGTLPLSQMHACAYARAHTHREKHAHTHHTQASHIQRNERKRKLGWSQRSTLPQLPRGTSICFCYSLFITFLLCAGVCLYMCLCGYVCCGSTCDKAWSWRSEDYIGSVLSVHDLSSWVWTKIMRLGATVYLLSHFANPRPRTRTGFSHVIKRLCKTGLGLALTTWVAKAGRLHVQHLSRLQSDFKASLDD